jgi:hypothetical protein
MRRETNSCNAWSIAISVGVSLSWPRTPSTRQRAEAASLYEFRLNKKRDAVLYQQGTYAPDSLDRWMGSIGMDRRGNIGIGYAFGGFTNFAGQRFAARLVGDPKVN